MTSRGGTKGTVIGKTTNEGSDPKSKDGEKTTVVDGHDGSSVNDWCPNKIK
jgi:hypothetical protein